MKQATVLCLILAASWSASLIAAQPAGDRKSPGRTHLVDRQPVKWHLDGRVTCPGTKAEGLLMERTHGQRHL